MFDNFDPRKMDERGRALLQKALSNPVDFGETFLKHPAYTDEGGLVPFKANAVQREVMLCPARDTYICIHRRAGKEQPLTSTVFTPSGPSTMGEMMPGSVVLTPDGGASRVLEVIPQGVKPVYRLTLDDGTTVEAGLDHEWEVYTALGWRGPAGASRKRYGSKVVTTREIVENLSYSYANREEFNYKLNPIEPASFSERHTPVDPYLLGVLLGDGHIKEAVGFTSADPQIAETIRARTDFYPKQGAPRGKNKTTFTYALPHSLKEQLVELGVYGRGCQDKFIPPCYLYNSTETRLWILRGLMDTDGSSDPRRRGQAEFSSRSRELALGVLELTRSLGCKATLSEGPASYTKAGVRHVTGTRYRLHIRIPEGLEIFNLERKKCGGLPVRYLRRTIVKAEYIGEAPVQCIAIDHPRHLYLTDGYTPTHNCVAGDTLIIDPVTNRPIPIEKAAHVERTLLFDFKSNETVWAPCSWVYSGKKNCVALSLSSGVRQTLSDDHLVFEWKRGWIQAGLVKVGDRLLSPGTLTGFRGRSAAASRLERWASKSVATGRIPDEPFSLGDESLRGFLRALFSEGGRLHGEEYAALMVWNRALCLDVQHLLKRLGIDSRIDEDSNLFIEDPIDLSMFLSLVMGLDVPVLQVHSPRRWEIVTETRKVGERPVYDLCVDHPDHNFIGNGLVLHNSFSLSVILLYLLCTSKRPRHAIFYAPSSTQVDAFFQVIDMWIDNNPWLAEMVEMRHQDPQELRLVGGSSVAGHVLGVSSSANEGKRGPTADWVFVDEGHLLTDKDWKTVTPILRGDIYRRNMIRGWIAGTLNEPVGEFYKKVDIIGDTKGSKVIKINVEQNPDWTDEMREAERAETPEHVWRTEYMLEVGVSDQAVFRRDDIDAAFEQDWELMYDPLRHDDIKEGRHRILTVDWDKFQAGVSIVVVEYNTYNGEIETLHWEEMQRSRFHYHEAVSKIVELYKMWQPTVIVADKGQGETQFEMLELYALQHPELDMANRIYQCAFQSKAEMTDITTGEPEKVYLKPFLVSLLNSKFQQRKIKIPHHLTKVRDQFVDYKRKEQTANTIRFTSHNEHTVDCYLFAMWAIHNLFENYKDGPPPTNPVRVVPLSALDPTTRDEDEETLWSNLEGARTGIGSNHVRSDLFSFRAGYGRVDGRGGLGDF